MRTASLRRPVARVVARVVALGALTLVALPFVAGCSSGSGGSGTAAGSGASGAQPGTLPVVASFYPLQFAVQQVGGSHVSVTSLTKPGAEPHDLGRPHDVARVADAGLVVYSRGFQPAVDTAVDQEGSGHAFDVAPTAHLDLAAPAEGDDPNSPGPAVSTPALAAATPTSESAPAGARDPHFWLDPQRYAAVASAIGARLAQADPAHAAEYTANAARFAATLGALDTELRTGLATCTQRELVTSHAAFGYLSERYGFTQVAIAGLSPDIEPSGARLAEIADFVKAHGVRTIYAETLVEPAFAQAVSRSTGAGVATLDPIEGITTASAGRDYLEVMRSNLATLRSGQGCS